MQLNRPSRNTDMVDGYHAHELLFPLGWNHFYTAKQFRWYDNNNAVPFATTFYMPSIGINELATEAGTEWLITTPGRLTNFRVICAANTINGATTFEFRIKRGVLTLSVTVTIPSSSGATSVLKNDAIIQVEPGDRLSVKGVSTGSSGTMNRPGAVCDYQVEPDNLARQIADVLGYGSTATYNAGGTFYLASPSYGDVLASNDRHTVSRAGWLKELRVFAAGNTCTKDINFRVVRGGSTVILEAVLLAGATTALVPNDQEVAVSAGDTLTLQMVVPSSPGGTLSQPLVSVVYEVPRDSESLPVPGYLVEHVRLGSSTAQSFNTTRHFGDHGNTPTATVNIRRFYFTKAGIVANLIVAPVSNTLNAGNAVFTVQKNGSDQALTVTVPFGSVTPVQDLSNSFTVLPDDWLSVKGVTGGASGSIQPAISFEILYPDSVDGILFPGAVEQGGRLTGTSGTPVPTSDQASPGTLYYTRFLHDRITLFDGVDLRTYRFDQPSLVLTGLLTNGRPHDVFLHDERGILTLSVLAWTNDTTRAEALATPYGCPFLTKGTDPRKRFLGTLYATGTGTFADSSSKRYLLNFYNAIPRPIDLDLGTLSWSENRQTWENWNSSTSWRVQFLAHPWFPVWIEAQTIGVADPSVTAQIGLNLDDLTGGGGATLNHARLSGYLGATISSGSDWGELSAIYSGYLAEGKHSLQGINRCAPTGNVLFGADSNSGYETEGGIMGWVYA